MKRMWALGSLLCTFAFGCGADATGSASNERIPLVRTTQLNGMETAPEEGCTVVCTDSCPSKCYAVCDDVGEPGAGGGSDPNAGTDCLDATLCFNADGSICGPACVVEYVKPDDCAVMVTVSPNGETTEHVCVEVHAESAGSGSSGSGAAGQGSSGEATSTDDVRAPIAAEAAPPPPDCGEPVACTLDAKICPDGSAVGRVAPSCEFAPCPGDEPVACTEDAKLCPDGSYVARVAPSCEFAPCPEA